MTAPRPRQDPLRDPRFFADPYPTYDQLRARCPVQRIPTGSGGHHAYLITGHSEAREAFTDPRLSKDTARFFADRPSNRDLHPAISRTMLASDPPTHTRRRRVATPLFTTGRVRALPRASPGWSTTSRRPGNRARRSTWWPSWRSPSPSP